MQRTISLESPVCVVDGWLLQTSLHNWINVAKRCVNILCEEKTQCSWPIWQYCCQGTTVEESKQCQSFQWAKAHKDWTDESNFIFEINRKVYVRRGVGERAANSFITPTVKHGLWCHALLPITKSGICARWRPNWIRRSITAYCSITRSLMERCLWLKDLYSC